MMGAREFVGVLISDFHLQNLADLLANDETSPRVRAGVAPFGQVVQTLADSAHAVWAAKPDFALVWTRPQAVIPSFGKVLAFESVPQEVVLAEVDAYADLLSGLAARVAYAFIPSWTLPRHSRGLGLLDGRRDLGAAYHLWQMNARLAQRLSDLPNLYFVDAAKWIVGAKDENPKLWYMGKIPFGLEVFREAARDLKAWLAALHGGAKKLVVLDLDDTLWGGIVGDLGWENIVLGGHDPVGEAFADFQRALKALAGRGILLGIVSKNEESIALEAIQKHPEMALRLEDFAGWRINWRDKAQNIADLVQELNLGPPAVVFIDDNPVERARVREALPEVLVPEWPVDKLLYPSTLLALRCFDAPVLSAEDRGRAQMYVAERKRKEAQASIGSLDDWLKTLEIKVTGEPLGRGNLARTAQLFNKTNQMNLSTRRLAESELESWAAQPGHFLWTFRVCDKLGDSGLTGIASLAVEGDTGRLVDFILSCRVMGRKIEETMLHVVSTRARRLGLVRLVATYQPTPKNKPCLEFWRQRSGFTSDETGAHFVWPLAAPCPLPDGIDTVVTDPA